MQSLPMKGPGLKLVLSLLKHQNSTGIDWFLAHIASDQFDKSDSVTCRNVFVEAAKLFIHDIKTVCESARPDSNPKPLIQYLSAGRGLLLVSALQKTVTTAGVFNDELAAILLSLESFLTSRDGASDAGDCSLLNTVDHANIPNINTSNTLARRKKTYHRGRKPRNRPNR